MNNTQQSAAHRGALWTLSTGQAMSLSVPAERRLRVVSGSLWLTTTGTASVVPEDVWLSPGDEWVLPTGTAWVVEARGEGEFQLLVPPQTRPWQAGWAALSLRWRSAWRPVPTGVRA